MMNIASRILFVTALTVASAALAMAQAADGRTSLFGKEDPDHPKTITESLAKMRIEKEKKEYDAMLTRGEEAVKISAEVQKSFESNGSLTENDLAKVAKVEKLVKKIREELGGNNDDDDKAEVTDDDPEPVPSNTAGALQTLKDKADALYDQLKKTTRFSISAAAIFSSNAVLKITRFLKLRN